MRYIRSCPNCSMELRFPLDMGILIITCPNCKTSFRMDPDDPRTFLVGNFDLSPVKKNTRFAFPFLNRINNYLYSNKDIQFIIPIFLFLILLLNLIKIFYFTEPTKNDFLNKEEQKLYQEFEQGNEPEENPTPESIPEKPSVEI